MKKKIIIGLTIYTSFFFLGGIYIIFSIQRTTSTLDNLIKLHQVEILREQLLIDAKMVQSDLAFKRTSFARDIDRVIAHVVHLKKEADKCTECHHSEVITERLNDLKNQVQLYEEAFSRVLTMRASPERMQIEENKAFQVGDDLVSLLSNMTAITKAKLERRTQDSLVGIDRMKLFLFVLISLGPFLGVVLAIILIEGFTKPLSVLLDATRKLKGGDLNYRVERLRYEFGEVAASFNEMASSLKDQMHKMQRAEQMTMVGEMAAGLVHEIKNPLAGIKASMQVLLEESDIPKEDHAVLKMVMSEVERIEALMKNLLNFAKPPKPLLLQVNMNDVLESTLALSLHSTLASKTRNGVKILRNLDPSLPACAVDPVQMQQVFLNLLMNGAEAMPEGGTLTVRTSENKSFHGIEIDISDTGTGIDEQLREKLFQPFFTTKHKGTGLGLAISKQFVEMNGGTISVEKNPEGGTIFKIILPSGSAEETPAV